MLDNELNPSTPEVKLNPELYTEIEKQWAALKLFIETNSVLDLIYAHDKIFNDITLLSKLLLEYADRTFSNRNIRAFVMHEINNKLGFFACRMRNQEDYESRPEHQASYELMITEGKEYLINCMPLILHIIYTKEFRVFTINDLIKFTGLDRLDIIIDGDPNANLESQHSFILIVLFISELFNNMSKYGGKKHESSISIVLQLQYLTISVKDNGKGLDEHGLYNIRKSIKEAKKKEVLNVDGSQGFGLKSIAKLGVGVQVNSEGIGQGTKVTLSIPVVAKES